MTARFTEWAKGVSYDPNWRERQLLAQFEPSQYGRKLTAAEEAARRAVDTAIEFICGKPGGGNVTGHFKTSHSGSNQNPPL